MEERIIPTANSPIPLELGALYADLDKICREAGELWCPEAEKRLFAYAGIDA